MNVLTYPDGYYRVSIKDLTGQTAFPDRFIKCTSEFSDANYIFPFDITYLCPRATLFITSIDTCFRWKLLTTTCNQTSWKCFLIMRVTQKFIFLLQGSTNTLISSK